jgi:hypothetical protein
MRIKLFAIEKPALRPTKFLSTEKTVSFGEGQLGKRTPY